MLPIPKHWKNILEISLRETKGAYKIVTLIYILSPTYPLRKILWGFCIDSMGIALLCKEKDQKRKDNNG